MTIHLITPEGDDLQVEGREADRLYAFCVAGLGHRSVQVEPADPSVGIFHASVWCEDCGVDLSNDDVINPKEY